MTQMGTGIKPTLNRRTSGACLLIIADSKNLSENGVDLSLFYNTNNLNVHIDGTQVHPRSNPVKHLTVSRPDQVEK